MFIKTHPRPLLVAFLIAVASLFQPLGASPASSNGLELPVIMRQKVDAAKTPVGTTVQAKLTVATLVNGVVIPEGAILSGEVTVSGAKSGGDPSRLAIRFDSAQWKNGSVPTVVALAPRLYLTPWVYPISLLDKDSSGGPDARETRNWGGGPGNIPPGAPPASQRFPGSGRNGDNDTIQGQKNPGPDSSNHRVLMKNVESSRTSDGGVTLTSQRSNIKLDKSTTYVLATSDLQPAK
ncbi:MAG: hypothetical protein ABSD75_14700 [Terriglobales bacterium]|jgi:hypothetical protein